MKKCLFLIICTTLLVGQLNAADLSQTGWRLLLDKQAPWKEDALFLPDEVDLKKLPVNAPTGGWTALDSQAGIPVTLPSTVEEHFWGKSLNRPYEKGEYFYYDSDPGVQNGNYLGVSWWWKNFESPALKPGQRLLIKFRAARLRAEVYVNQKLCGYNLITEVPFEADVTDAVKAGAGNTLAVRITNPGGFLDWTDWGPPILWGKYQIPRSHGFGGLDAGIELVVRDPLHVAELAVLNHPQPREVTFVADLKNTGPAYHGPLQLQINREGRTVWQGQITIDVAANSQQTVKHTVNVPEAELWDLKTPVLYQAQAVFPDRAASAAQVNFGFRWFAPDGIHDNAVLRLNGRRIVVVSAISWGYWPYNGLWPDNAFAEKEVRSAKELGLNCIQFHRNIGHTNVLDAHDRLGLLRYQEPGAGKNAYTPLDKMGGIAGARSDISQPPLDLSGTSGAPSEFRMRYQTAKILAMVKRDRSHPSLIVYCLQNEQNPPLTWPTVPWLFRQIQEIDPSRTVYLHSGIPVYNQLVALPYQKEFLHERGDSYSGWFDKHTVGGPGVYRDELYVSPRDYSHYTDNKKEIVIWGEMLGSGVPDDHEAILQEHKRNGRTGYDQGVHERALDAYNRFLDRWDFRQAYPTASTLFRQVGARSYYFWQKIMEQSRFNDLIDYPVISGWESTTIENHSGIVDYHRNFRADPKLLSVALQPELLVLRPRHFVLPEKEELVLDVHLINETNRKGPHQLRLSLVSEEGQMRNVGEYPVEAIGGETFGQLLREDIRIRDLPVGLVTLKGELFQLGQSSPVLVREEKVRVVALQKNPLLKRVAVLESGQHVATALKNSYGIQALDTAALDQPLDAVILAQGTNWSPKTQYLGDTWQNAPLADLYRAPAQGGEGVIGVWDGLSTGLCRVEIMLGEFVHKEEGQRRFDLEINSERVLTDFDPFKECGGRLKALVKQFEVDLPTGALRIAIPKVGKDAALLFGIKVTDSMGKVIAVCFRDKPITGPDGLVWTPFALAGTPIKDAVLDQVLKRVEQEGLRLIIWSNGMGDSASLATQLAARGILKYQGPIAEARASWMGSWYFVRQHWLFDGLPVDQAFDWQYQVPAAGKGVGGLQLEAMPDKPIEVMVGYARDHEALVGAGAAIIHHGKGIIVLPSLPGLRESLSDRNGSIAQPIALLLLGNALMVSPQKASAAQ